MKTKSFIAVAILCAAIMLVGCKSKTCKVTAINKYNQFVKIYLSTSNDTTGTQYIIDLPAGTSASKDGIDLTNMNAVFYIGTGNMIGEDIYELKYSNTMSLSECKGMRYVTLTVNSEGLPSVDASDM